MVRHFLSLMDLSSAELKRVIDRAGEFKQALAKDERHTSLQQATLALLFDKSSTRTRVSFETAMTQLGGNSIFLATEHSQLGRGEPVADTARVMSRMVDVIVIRTSGHDMIETFAEHSQVPVINGLTNLYHPCQLLADIQTYKECRGDIAGCEIAWVGDGNNMCHSWINAARQFDFRLRIATPDGFGPNPDLVAVCSDHVTMVESPSEAARGAHAVVTDTWASMGQEGEKEKRIKAFSGYMVDKALMSAADKKAIFMHCLPAYRGFEVVAEVIDGPQSVVWQQAENRLHAQKALLEFLLIEF
ncbi:MAG TPA: ornithine carbamoyltransferase [Acidiferrobacteraceae bacterium]|nr:ornithine carbamoyltransferase [Acidiferrobacteraceae bacterium]